MDKWEEMRVRENVSRCKGTFCINKINRNAPWSVAVARRSYGNAYSGKGERCADAGGSQWSGVELLVEPPWGMSIFLI